MKDDYEMLVWKLPNNLSEMHLYPLGDMHCESEGFDEEAWANWKKVVFNDPIGYIVIVGDMFDVAIKGSKGNPAEAKHRLRDRKRWLAEELKPMKNRILGAVRGNHELRAMTAADDCPLYDVMCKLDIEDVYRENMAFIKVSLGQRKKDRQATYTIVLGHGDTDKKTEDFGATIDGMDVFITGHTHKPHDTFPAKLVIDPYNNVVREVGYVHLTVPSFQKLKGYALRGMYKPQDGSKIPMLTLSGKEKKVEVTWK